MLHVIARAVGRVQAFRFPRGRHRPAAAACVAVPKWFASSTIPTGPRSGPPHRHPAPTVTSWDEPIDGTATPFVRPYLTAYEREEKARLQRLRRDALWLATYGVDLDIHDIDIHAWLGGVS
ncbi:hypothetical protein [Streptomyces sp. NPDC001978]|uniref:hypothetical protein n=1 Tax=Streptomyces sp. NPDC001978 TaxID=3364627 RepID=UPI0036781C4B